MSVADGLRPSGPCHPSTYHNVGASILKDEDVLLVEYQRPWPGSSSGEDGESVSVKSPRCSCCGADKAEYSIFAVFDGHNGAAAARLVAEALVEVLEERLPQGVPPPATSPTWVPWREDIQLALVETMAELNRLFALKGILAGCTATLVLQIGWLLTCANLGDSRAILDTGLETLQLTVDHCVATHKGERRRVATMGNNIAPINFAGSGPATRMDNGVGPLRIWPGGLCLSRAIGDFDVGDSVIPFPHIMQVLVPPTGARLLVASDGVWDAYEKMNRIGSMLRNWSLDACPRRLIQSIVRAYGGLRDDTSLVVADIVPPGKTFPEAVQAAQACNKLSAMPISGGGGCGCFGRGAPPLAPARPMSAPRVSSALGTAAAHNPLKLEILADVDVAAVMGLMPEEAPEPPGWYDEYVGEQLFALAAQAMGCWQEANERRTGRHPSTPQIEASVRAGHMAHASSQMESEGPWEEASGMRRNASVFFAGATAEGDVDYAEKFGHYKGFQPESVGSESPGSSMHSSRPGGDASVRAGGYRFVDASVRAGSRYTGDVSMRVGGRFADASVRAGSAGYDAAAAGTGVAGSGGSNGGGSGGGGIGSFRLDPSIRCGSAALRYFSDSAGSGDGGAKLLADAAAAEEFGRHHGMEGSGPFVAAAAAAEATMLESSSSSEEAQKSGGAAPGSTTCALASSGSASAPIPVPSSVSFGAVNVMGAKGKAAPAKAQLEDSPMDFRGSLQAAGSSGPMYTILEG